MFDFFNFAYLDPGTGSLIIQSLIGVIAGVTVFGRNAVRTTLHKAKGLFSGSKSSKSETKTETE
jgi:hypothetical protein